MRKIIFDSRVKKGKIWNVKDVISKFPFGEKDSLWNKEVDETTEEWIDDFVYEGFTLHGKEFLKALEGRFAIVYHDIERNRIFLARDWIGEMSRSGHGPWPARSPFFQSREGSLSHRLPVPGSPTN